MSNRHDDAFPWRWMVKNLYTKSS